MSHHLPTSNEARQRAAVLARRGMPKLGPGIRSGTGKRRTSSSFAKPATPSSTADHQVANRSVRGWHGLQNLQAAANATRGGAEHALRASSMAGD
jgi:hypothetical protein